MADTSYVIVADPGLEGSWTFTPPPIAGGDNEVPSEQVVQILITRSTDSVQTNDKASGPVDVIRWFTKPRRTPEPRYSIRLSSNGPPSAAPDITLEGQLIPTARHMLLTVQPSPSMVFPVGALVVPVQQTFRIDRDGDKMTIWRPRVQLVYVPIPMAGELQFKAPAAASSAAETIQLAQTGDQMLNFLANCLDENWVFAGTATRTR